MNKIKALNIARFVNATHFAFMKFVMNAIAQFDIIGEKFAIFVAACAAAFAKEDHAYLNLDRSFLTGKLAAAKADREVKMRTLRDAVKLCISDTDAEKKNAAEILMKVIDGYGGTRIPSLSADAQSGIYTNLVEDLEEKYNALVQILVGVEVRVEALKLSNINYLELQEQRTKFDAEIGKRLMEAARRDMDEAYRSLTDTINALIGIGHGAEFQPFVNYLNVRIDEERSKLGQTSSKPEEGGEELEVPDDVTLTFEKANEEEITLTGEPGTEYEIPETEPEHIWVGADDETVVPDGIFPLYSMAFVEVPVGDRRSANFHFINGEHETITGLPGTEYQVPASTIGYKWVPTPTGYIPEVDTQYFEELAQQILNPAENITIKFRGTDNQILHELVVPVDYQMTEEEYPTPPEGTHWNFTLADLNLAIGMKNPGDTITVRAQA